MELGREEIPLVELDWMLLNKLLGWELEGWVWVDRTGQEGITELFACFVLYIQIVNCL